MSGTLWPRAIAGVYGAFALAMGAFVVFTLQTPTELVAADSYDRAQRHQEQMDRNQRGLASTGYAFTLEAAARRATLQLPDAAARGRIHLYRPSDAALDRAIPIAPDAAGTQVLDLGDCAAGLWRVQVDWEQGAETFSRAEVMVLP